MPKKNNTGGRNKSNKKKKTTKKVLFKLFKIAILLLFIAVVLAGMGLLAVAYSYVKDAPELDVDNLNPPVTSYIYDREGNEITKLYDEQNRKEIPLEMIPKHVQQAFIAIEDERFYDHYGVDPMAILRAVLVNLRQNSLTGQGGSTITQQLIKDAFLTPEKKLRRKIQEAWLALKLERQYSKSEILEMYLNRIPFAHGAYGIEAAANTYFNKSTGELTIAEAALLAGVPRAPNYYSPYKNLDQSLQRQSLVLNKMYELGYITHRELTEAKEEEIVLEELQGREYPYPYFIDYVLHHELVDILLTMPGYESREEAYEAIYNMGLKIYTTLDTDAQTAVTNILSDESLCSRNIRVDMAKLKQILENEDLKGYPEEVISEDGILQPQAAAVVANPVTGEVLALVGGRDYGKDNQDLRFISRRQPGSAMKPLVTYAPAMEEGLLTPGSIIDDSPFIRGTWAPENFDRAFRGLITVREALVRSWNVPAVRAFEIVTPQIGLEYAKSMGLSTIHENDYNLATTLGGLTYGVTAFDMAQAYAVLANQGVKVSFFTVERIEDRDGHILYDHRAEPEAVLSPQTAFLITDILKDVVRRGTAGALRVGRTVAAKTGTTNEDRDAYLVAYTPEIVVSFWIGHDIQKLGTVPGGSRTPVDYMNKILPPILEDIPPSDFERPSGITGPISICNKSGLRPGPHCPDEAIVSEIFPAGMVPQETCDLHLEMEVCSASELLPGDFCPEEEIETRIFLNRPEFQLTDERWRGAGRGPQDAAQMPPEEQCDIHTVPATAPSGFDGYILQNPPRVLLRWNAQRDIVEYRIYRKVSGKTSGNNQEENTGEENEGAGINEELLLQTLPGTVTQYLDSWVEAETEYTYSLVAINTEGIKSAPLRRVLFIPQYNSPGDQNGNGNNNDGSDNEGGSGDDRDHHRDDDDDDGHDRPPQRDPDRWPPDNNENRDRRDRNNRH